MATRTRRLQLLVAGALAVMTKVATAPVLLLLPVAAYVVIARDRQAGVGTWRAIRSCSAW